MNVRQVPERIACALIRGYQYTLSPFIGNQCRFHPTCSYYAIQAIECHGLMRGLWLALRRLLKCHPFHPGGTDLVPERVPERVPESVPGHADCNHVSGNQVHHPQVKGATP